MTRTWDDRSVAPGPAPVGPTRRTVLRIGVGAGVAVALPWHAGPAAAAAPPAEPVVGPPAGALRTVPLEGTGLQVELRRDAATVLTHVARRFHYEVRPVAAVDGYRAGQDGTPRVAAHAAGTAVHLDPAACPVGVPGTLHPHELAALRSVLADTEGLVVWGGDDEEPCEGHLRLAVPADDPAVARLAQRVARHHGAPPTEEVAADLGPQSRTHAEGVLAAGAGSG